MSKGTAPNAPRPRPQLTFVWQSFRSVPQVLKDQIRNNEQVWKKWIDDNQPETLPIPDIEPQVSADPTAGPFMRLLLVRMLRMDRTLLAMTRFITETACMGDKYTEPITHTIGQLYDEMPYDVPVISLLSVGADANYQAENGWAPLHVASVHAGRGSAL